MATYENTRLLVDGARSQDNDFSHTIYRATVFLSDLSRTVKAWNNTRKTRAALAKLSDRALDDIGLCRADIGTVNFSASR